MLQESMFQQKTFFTPEQYAFEQRQRMESSRGKLVIASCRAGRYLADKIVAQYNALLKADGSQDEVLYLPDIDYQFSDTETSARLKIHVGGYDVFLIQALYNPILGRQVDQNYLAFLIGVRTFRDHGARHVTAILPYLAYARQDKPTRFMREPITAKLMADLTIEAGIDRIVTWDPHSDQLSGFYSSMPVDMLDPLTLFVEAFHRFRGRDDVIAVAPDAGASKFITYFGRALDLRMAIASKVRPRQEEAIITEIIGDFSGKRTAIVLDDMISSGGTVYELIKTLVRDKGIQEVYMGASHNLCMDLAYERLIELQADYGLKEVIITNSIPQTEPFLNLPCLSICCLSDTLSRTINRIHYNRSVSQLFR